MKHLCVFLAGQKQFGRDVLQLLLRLDYVTVVGVSAPVLNSRGDNSDRLRDLALQERLPTLVAGTLKASNLPACDLIIAAHSHDFVGRLTRAKATLGAIGYHPSLLPRHRGRDAVRWTIRIGDPIAGGTVFWLNDTVDGGPIAAQDWCWVHPGDTAETLWRQKLAPMGLKLLRRTLEDIRAGVLRQTPQDPEVATWEPSWERPPLARPDLLMLGDGTDRFRALGFTVVTEDAA